ncbi:MAG: hypothetical protein Q7P63_17480 [Verrucomicrobiota bacterium JB022]|nr:hypothetical protein [Verrucomicrobiota bacterium JB022]
MPRPLILFLSWIVLVFGAPSAMAKDCVQTGCVSLAGRLLSVDSTKSPILNALLGGLLGTNVNLTAVEWDSLMQADVNLVDYLNLLSAQVGAGGPDQVLESDLTLAQILNAQADLLTAQGDLVAAGAARKLALATPIRTIRLSEYLDVCVECGEVADARFNVFDLITGAVLVLNHDAAVTTPTPITISGSAIGLGGVVNQIKIAVGGTPPLYRCGPTGMTLYGAALRIYLHVDLVNIGLSTQLSVLSLPIGVTNLTAQIGQLDLYFDLTPASATLVSVNPDTPVVELNVTPGITNLYAGYIDPALFFDLDRPVNQATDLTKAKIGGVNVTVIGIPVAANINVSGYALGTAPFQEMLTFFGPYPEEQTAGTSAVVVDTLLSTLLQSLSLEVKTEAPLVGGLLNSTFNLLLGVLVPALQTIVPDVLDPILVTILAGVVDPLLQALGIGIGEADVSVNGAQQSCTYNLSGYVYQDLDGNGTRGSDENGTGLALYAKAISLDGTGTTALAQATVDPVTGSYTLTGLKAGAYRIIVDDNATLSDVTPVAISGYAYTESGNGERLTAIGLGGDLNGINFGLRTGYQLQGLAFYDHGIGGGTAYDGVQNGGETGYSAARWSIVRQADSSTLASGTTAADGSFSAFLPGGLAASEMIVVTVEPARETERVSGNAGNSGGSFSGNTLSFAFNAASAPYTGLRWGFADHPTFQPDAQHAAAPGDAVWIWHRFTAGAPGQVTFSARGLDSETSADTVALFHDLNKNGSYDAGEPSLTAPISVNAGDEVQVLVKYLVPLTDADGAQHAFAIDAQMVFGATGINATRTVNDRVYISSTDANLVIRKTVDKTLAAPGETLTYTLEFENLGSGPVRQIRLSDQTPVFSVFVEANEVLLPAGLSVDSRTLPSVNDSGPVRWVFAGDLAPAALGRVTFKVRVE